MNLLKSSFPGKGELRKDRIAERRSLFVRCIRTYVLNISSMDLNSTQCLQTIAIYMKICLANIKIRCLLKYKQKGKIQDTLLF